MSELAHNLKARRLRARLSQQQLGELAGIHRFTVRQAETGQHVRGSTLIRIDQVLTEREQRPRPSEATPPSAWLDLARRVTESERTYRRLAEECWQSLDLTKAALYRGMADGLAMARDHHTQVVAEQKVERSSGGDSA